jgi:uncharacterized membrane protein YedE/YeeE
MTVSLASLLIGCVVGYLGQRSRMCTIGGLRDFVLVRDTGLLKGVGAMLATSWLAFGAIRLFDGGGLGHELVVAATKPSGLTAVAALIVGGLILGFIATLSGACPLRQHVLAGQGRIGAWWFLAGFYLMAIVYTSWVQPSIGGWVL